MELLIKIFLEAPIELQTLILGGLAALIMVLVKGNKERDDKYLEIENKQQKHYYENQ